MRISFEGDHAEVILPLYACGWGYTNSGCKLHRAAARRGVSRVCDFFAPRGSEELPWFPVAAGLASVRGLQAELERAPESVCDADCSVRDLAELERVLLAAPSDRFRLSILRKSEQTASPCAVEGRPGPGEAPPVSASDVGGPRRGRGG